MRLSKKSADFVKTARSCTNGVPGKTAFYWGKKEKERMERILRVAKETDFLSFDVARGRFGGKQKILIKTWHQARFLPLKRTNKRTNWHPIVTAFRGRQAL